MTRLHKGITGKSASTALLSLGLSALLAGLIPASARAADDGRYGDRWGRDYRYGDERRYDRVYRDDDRDHSRDGGWRSRYWVEPTYRTFHERVWVEPVYRIVTERIWVEPVYKTVYEDVYVPARYEERDSVRYECGRRVAIHQRVLVDPACTRRIARNVCVSEGHWDVVERRVCVSEGRWDYRVEAALSVRF